MILLAPLALAGVTTTAPPPGLASARAPRRVALLVGVDTYDDGALPDLKFAAKDAADLGRVLDDDAVGDFDEVRVLSGRVDRATLLAALDDAGRRLQRDDLFVFYYAGHGTMDLSTGETDLYLLPSDGLLSAPRVTGIAQAELAKRLKALPARRRALVVDACNAGQGRSSVSVDTRALLDRMRGNVPTPALLELGRMDAQLFAARPTDPAMESEALDNGVYTHFLVEALRGEGDADGDGLVDVHEAHEWARDRTLRYTSGLQVPWIRVDEEGRVPIYLTGTDTQRDRARRAILTGLESLPAASDVRVDGRTRGGGALEPGWHTVEVVVDGEPVLATRVHAAAGELVSVEGLLARRQADVALAVGGAWAPFTVGEPLAPAVAPVVRFEVWPADTGGGRPSFGLQALPAWGAVADVGNVPTVTTTAFGTWTWGDRLAAGPELAVGALARFPEEGAQLGPVASAAGLMRYGARDWLATVSLGAEVPLLAVDGARTVTPRVTATVGWRP